MDNKKLSKLFPPYLRPSVKKQTETTQKKAKVPVGQITKLVRQDYASSVNLSSEDNAKRVHMNGIQTLLRGADDSNHYS